MRILPLVTALITMPGPAGSGDHSGALLGPARGGQLHVMSLNVRVDTPNDPHPWRDRRPAVRRLLELEHPTLLGIQEGLYHQVLDIESDLPGRYGWLGQGREGGNRGEFVAIYFAAGRLAPLAHGHFWLSETPGVAGSASWGNTAPRMVTWARFADLRTGTELAVLNTHFDHRSERARQLGAAAIRERLPEIAGDLPVLLLGDFNTVAGDSATFTALTGDGTLADAWDTATERLTPAYGTFNNYARPVEGEVRIDWILTGGRIRVLRAAVNPFTRRGGFPSDHMPVQALVEVAAGGK